MRGGTGWQNYLWLGGRGLNWPLRASEDDENGGEREERPFYRVKNVVKCRNMCKN